MWFIGVLVETKTKKIVRRGLATGAVMILAFLILALVFLPLETNRVAANESLAASSLRTILNANIAYAEGHPQQGFVRKLSDLSQQPGKPEHSEIRAWVIDATPAGGEKSGYKFIY